MRTSRIQNYGVNMYTPAPERYVNVKYRRVAQTGLQLPPISLGFWHNFGDDKPLQTQRDLGTPLAIHQPSYSMLNR